MCLRLLTARARTRAELAARLADRGFAVDVAEPVLDRLGAAGLIDDADFADQWVHRRRASAGKGRRALAAELRQRGVDGAAIDTALDGLDTGVERDRAEHLVGTALRREKSLDADDDRIVRRLAGLLARRGFAPSVAREVILAGLAAERDRRRT